MPDDDNVRNEVAIDPDVTRTLLGLVVTVRPGTVGTVALRLTVPTNPWLITLISVDDGGDPAGKDGIELDEIEKSHTLTCRRAE